MSNTVQSEKEILGAILLDEGAFWECSEYLSPESFTTKDHQKIYAAMASLARNDRSIRASAMAARLDDMEGDVPALVYLAQLIEIAKAARSSGGVPVAENAEDLARAFVKRQIAALLKRVEKSAASPTADPFDILDGLIGQASDLVHAADQQIERTIGQVGEEVKTLLQEAIDQKGIGLTTGLFTVDDIVGRFFPGDFVLLGGQPGGGKTAIAMQMALFMAQFVPVAFIELEMESRMILLRTIASVTSIPVRKMLEGVKTGQFDTASDAIQKLGSRKLHMVAQRGMTITQLEARIRSMRRRHGIQIAFIDHLGLIKRPGKFRMAKHDKDFDNAEDLMELGKALKLPIIALCHLTKMARQRDGDPEPTMEDFSGGGMEQHADLMLCTFNRFEWLERNKPKTGGKAMEHWLVERRNSENRMELFKLKDRKGTMRQRVILHWDGARTLFSDLKDDVRQTELIGMDDLP